MNYELLEQKERLFEDYRRKFRELEATKEQARDHRAVLEALHEQCRKLEYDIDYMRELIEYMIKNDLDPVTAKIKFQEQEEARRSSLKAQTFHHPVYASSMASTSTTVGSVGAIGSIGAAGGCTYTQNQNSAGIVAQTVDDLFKDSNKYDTLWLDH
jgi:hypothetical protein